MKIPLLFVVQPRVLRLNKKSCEVMLPLNYWTRNHVRSMYFGALSIGADLAGGVIALDAIERAGNKVGFIFKDFKADFLRRAEADVHFFCHDGEKIRRAVKEAMKSGKRVNTPMNIVATTPRISGDQPVARFVLTLSLKVQS